MKTMIKTKQLVSFLATAFLSFNLSANTLLDRVVAVVNEDIILLSELEQQVDLAATDLRQRGIQAPPSEILTPRVLENMVMQTLQNQRAQQRGLEASDDEINAQLNDMAQANNLSLLQLREVLNNEMPNGFRQMRDQIAEQIVIQKLREVEVISRIDVTEDEIQNYLQRQKLQTNQDEYQLGHILITRPDTPTPQQRTELESKVQDLYQQLKQGADFAQMAVRHSEGSKALNGGDLGWLKIDQMPSFFVTEVLALEPGQLSRVIDSPAGFHILKLIDKRNLSQQPTTETQERQAIQAIRIRKANETFDLWMRRLRDEAFVDIRLEAQD